MDVKVGNKDNGYSAHCDEDKSLVFNANYIKGLFFLMIKGTGKDCGWNCKACKKSNFAIKLIFKTIINFLT